MAEIRPIRSALLSVYHKDGLDRLALALHERGIEIWSTGGTRDFLEGLGVKTKKVEDLTGYPSILGGRVKTLHPKVFGGILHRSEHMDDLNEMAAHEIPPLDLVIVDLYPFEQTLLNGGTNAELIEKIDIGGISLLRAAAKNHQQCTVVSSARQYPRILNQILEQGGTSLTEREAYAAEAFAVTSHYDRTIFDYLNRDGLVPALRISNDDAHVLRYGENPHQKANFYGPLDQHFEVLSGKALSYNNLLDVDAAVSLLSEFHDPTFVVIKHNNACGLASREHLTQAWKDALAGDPVSAFGGVLAANRCIDLECASAIDQIFYEVLIAPDFTTEAVELLSRKKNRILLRLKSIPPSGVQVRSILGGYLVQDPDSVTESTEDFKVVTRLAPQPSELEDMVFALKIVKHTRSNAIVLVRNRQLIGSGTGQSSRIDAMRQAAHKARTFDFDVQGAVMASDAFFPFADSVEVAFQEGIRAVVQPGGSVKDQDSIDFCDRNNMAMVMTGRRHFKH